MLDESRRLTSIENAEALVNLQLSMAFLSTVILLRIQPGPDNMLVIARGIAQGRAVALFAVFWISAGAGIVQLPLVTFGVSSLVLASPVALKALQLAAVYWIWSGVRMFFSVPMANEVKNADRIMPLASS
ncbi:LysE family transporter [Mesorhizobium sp. VK4C]|uniref:LysE family translocator n=1 Tax=Mesorhizobium captivum TaxID=3072319 RepID=UPI002A244013|nr:LysE family transporter [Mesorhizobium sp. VK4C]MDX8500834.1 LysE family transporter [Mesorhizobium sp. VK4C]